MANGLKIDGVAGYIDLNTSLLNGFVADDSYAVIVVCEPVWKNNAPIWSGEAASESSPRLSPRSTFGNYRFFWEDDVAGSIDAQAVFSVDGPAVFVCSKDDLGTSARGFLLIDGTVEADDTSADDWLAPDATGVRLGTSRHTPNQHLEAKYGFVAIIDYASIPVEPDEVYVTGLTTAIKAAGDAFNWDAEQLRLAILDYDSALTGQFWKMDEAGSSGQYLSSPVKRYDLVTGSDGTLIVNGAMSHDSEWIQYVGGTVAFTLALGDKAPGSFGVSGAGAGEGMKTSTAFTVTDGKAYRLSFSCRSASGAFIRWVVGNQGGASTTGYAFGEAAMGTDWTRVSTVFLSGTTDATSELRFIFPVGESGSFFMDDVSLVEIEAGPELVTNGTFTGNSTGWTEGTGWAYATNDEDKTAGTASDLSQDGILVSGRTYVVSFDLTAVSAGAVKAVVGSTDGIERSTTGTYTEVLVAAGADFDLNGNAAFAGTIDNVSVRVLNDITSPSGVSGAILGGGVGGGYRSRRY